MAAHRAVFTDMLPTMEYDEKLRLFFLTVTAEGHCVCTPLEHFKLFLAEANARVALIENEERRVAEIIPFGRKPPD